MATANEMMLARVIADLERRLDEDRKINFPAALRKVGRRIIKYTQETHEYQNQTGALERSHDFVVLGPGESEEVVITTRAGPQPITLTSPEDEVHLYLVAKQQYGLWVELRHGLSVLIDGFLKLRREFGKLFGAALRSGRVR